MAPTVGAQKAREFVLYSSDGATVEVYAKIGGVVDLSDKVSNSLADITDKDDAGYRTLLAGAGISSRTITLSGEFKTSTALTRLEADSENRVARNYCLVREDGSAVELSALVEDVEASGGNEGALKYSFTLQSSGAWDLGTFSGTTFTPA
jgi:predicted secreted protein